MRHRKFSLYAVFISIIIFSLFTLTKIISYEPISFFSNDTWTRRKAGVVAGFTISAAQVNVSVPSPAVVAIVIGGNNGSSKHEPKIVAHTSPPTNRAIEESVVIGQQPDEVRVASVSSHDLEKVLRGKQQLEDKLPKDAKSTAGDKSKQGNVVPKSKQSTPQEVPYEVEGWPKAKSRSATDYVDYDANTATLMPSVLQSDIRAGPRLLIAVHTSPMNRKQRDEVRNTWGRDCTHPGPKWCSLVFLVGQSSAEAQTQLVAEQQQHHDILQDAFVDSYNNLTIKTIFMLKFFSSHMDAYDYLFKTDDDSFVHVNALKVLVANKASKKSSNIVGHLMTGSKKNHYLPLAHKPTKGLIKAFPKWIMPSYMYNRTFFPQFVSGSGYLVPGKSAECLLKKTQVTPIIHLEDVYTTGLCAVACKLGREHNKGCHSRFTGRFDKYNLTSTDIFIHRSNGYMERFQSQADTLKLNHGAQLTRTNNANSAHGASDVDNASSAIKPKGKQSVVKVSTKVKNAV